MYYRIVGFLVIKAARWYMRRHTRPPVPRTALLAAAVGAGVALAFVAGARRAGSR